MLYDYQYTLTAILVSLVLLGLVYQRRNYASPSNRVFIWLLYANLLAEAADMFTFWTISYPERYARWLLYLSNIVYLWLFGIVSASFLWYITALVGEKRIVRNGFRQFVCAAAAEGLLLAGTPWTHWIFYYDGSGTYLHGSFFWIMYLIPIVLIMNGICLLMTRKYRFSAFQRATAVIVFVIALAAAAVQMVDPRADIFHMMCVMIMLTVFIVFENPAYYTYHNTRCMNGKAFHEEAERINAAGLNADMLFIGIVNRKQNHGVQEAMRYTALLNAAAERLWKNFGRNVYCLDDGKFIVMQAHSEAAGKFEAEETVRAAFAAPVYVNGGPAAVETVTRAFRFRDVEISDDFVDHLIETVHAVSAEDLAASRDIAGLMLEQHKYREIEDAAADAAADDRFYLMYQPIYDMAAGCYHSAEALLRLEDPRLGNIRPDVFIPIVESNGSIGQIGEMVLEKACRMLCSEEWRNSGMEFLEVNVSPVQLLRPDMAERFIRIMQSYNIDPSMINLEITESSLDFSSRTVLRNIQRLQEFGICFSIDDYGSGFASVDTLFKLPVTIVKIDRSILLQAMLDDSALLVFNETISMVRKLHKRVVVEGAETEEMVKLIRNAGGDYIQGYYYSRPLKENELLEFLNRQRA